MQSSLLHCSETPRYQEVWLFVFLSQDLEYNTQPLNVRGVPKELKAI